MNSLSLICDLTILSKYSTLAKLEYQRCVKENSDAKNFQIVIPISEAGVSKSDDLFAFFKSLSCELYFKQFAEKAEQLSNIFFLLNELTQELYYLESKLTIGEPGGQNYLDNAIESLEFLYSLLKIKERHKDTFEIIIQNKSKSVQAKASVTQSNLIPSNIIDGFIEYISKLRFTNDVLFNSIQPSDFETKTVLNILRELKTKEIQKVKFITAHYCSTIVKYLNQEIENKPNSLYASAKQYRLIFEWLKLFNLSYLIVPDNELPDHTNTRLYKSEITRLTKKFLENHTKSKYFDYKKGWKSI